MIQTTLFPYTFRQLYSLSNDDIANVFEQVSELLEAQGENYYRIRAYRKGAEAVRSQSRSVVDIFELSGTAGLEEIPYIGRRLSQSIKELAETGDLTLLQRLSIDVSPEDIFTTVPGVGQVLARRLYRGLGLRSLEDLEQAAETGLLVGVPGFGQERITHIQRAVASLLSQRPSNHISVRHRPSDRELIPSMSVQRPILRSTRSHTTPFTSQSKQQPEKQLEAPTVSLLLEIDQQYRYLAKAGQLRMVTPKRFNPEGKAWLPVMQIEKEGWKFNALYSNTQRSHDLGKTHDWVVINYERGKAKGQCTIVTESRGAQKGTRVVRGREAIAA